MARVLVYFASIDGQTERVARSIGAVIAGAGHAVELKSATEPGFTVALEEADAVIVGAGIRFGHHPAHLVACVRENRAAIMARPNAFFSVSLSAGGAGAKPANARAYVDDFVRDTGWDAHATATFAGALRYSRYNLFIRFMMKLIVGAAGGETDTSRDYEYTDWAAVERFAVQFARELRGRDRYLMAMFPVEEGR